MNDATAREVAYPQVVSVDAQVPQADARGVTPWPIFRTHIRAIGMAVATCLVVLLTIEIAVFRSGFFVSHLNVSNPQTPAAKLALAARHPDTRVLYVGDSTIMTSVLPAIVASRCECGPGFNGAFSGADPWLTAAMTRRLLTLEHPDLVVIDVPPWTVNPNARFADSEFARQLLSQSELSSLGVQLGLADRIDDWLGRTWSSYGQRDLIKESLTGLTPGQRYDESLLGYYVAPGAANSPARLAAAAQRLFQDVGDPTSSAPGAIVIGSLIDELRARGIKVAIFTPPLPAIDYEEGGPFLERADAVIRQLAADRGVPIVDCRPTVAAGDFRDATHLLTSGAEKHSACVGEELRTIARD